MQVADIISWSLGTFACFHKREVGLCACVCVFVLREGRAREWGEKWFQIFLLQFVVSDK